MLPQLDNSKGSEPRWAAKARPSHRITAVRLEVEADGKFSVRGVTQIEPQTILSVCGPGLNDLTLRVRVASDNYLVFKQDIRSVDQPE